MASEALTWQCICGAVQFTVSPEKAARCICYCKDCQAFARHFSREDWLEHASGSDLLQAMPHEVRLAVGAEHLACLKLSDKGPIRWYAACCGTPICNTGASRRVPLASMLVRGFGPEAALPAITAHVNRKGATARIEGDMGSTGKLVRLFLSRAALSVLTGKHRKTPFFDAAGAPVARPSRLSDEDRARAYGG